MEVQTKNMDFGKMAQLCIESEINHALSKQDGDPKARIGINGNYSASKIVHVMTSPSGNHLTGTPIEYIRKYDITAIDILCEDIRNFYNEMGWIPEEFAYSEKATIH